MISKRTHFLTIMAFVMIHAISIGQTSTEFWLAPPKFTFSHGSNHDAYLRITSSTSDANVTIEMPAEPAFTPINVFIPANTSYTEDMTPYFGIMMTPSNDAVNNTGLHIISDANITAYYELDTYYNPDIIALKGANGLGTEFYVPLQNEWTNGNYTPDLPYTSFDIVATEDNTVVSIYPKTDLDFGHPALQSFTIFLDRGQTYSGSVGVADLSIPASENPVGTVILSNHNIAVSVKDDSVNPTGFGCRDIMTDQIIPTDILGMEYIAQKGFLSFDDNVYVLATQNNTQVFMDGVLQTILFAGELFIYDLSQDVVYVNTSKPAYVYQATGFGCEVGMAILPPLTCAGSTEVSFVRSSTERFGLNILTRVGNEGNFTLNGDPSIITAADFQLVPGNTNWMYAQVDWGNNDESEIPQGIAQRLVNSSGVFALGLVNGGNSSGCRFGYFSEFSAETLVDAGIDDVVCGNDSIQLSGSVSGGATSGEWETSGSGYFSPNEFELDAWYVPSTIDEANGSVTLTLKSVGGCFEVTDDLDLTITPSPTIDLGPDVDVCENNPITILTATTTVAANAIWGGGSGSFTPTNVGLNVTYEPSQSDIDAGSITLFANSAAQGTCNSEADSIVLNFTPSPTADAGTDITVCANNAEVSLNGQVTVAAGGVWSGGAGLFSPNPQTLNATYQPTPAEINSGGITLTLTTTNPGTCLNVSDQVDITFSPAPQVDAGMDDSYCANNAEVGLNGSVLGAGGGQWTGGLGSYSPNSQTLNATYTPSQEEINNGFVTLTLTSTNNATCLAEEDQVTFTFTPAPTVDAGLNQSLCSNNAEASLTGTVTVATGAQWSGGDNPFTPNANSLNVTYQPSAAEIASGSVRLYLTSTGNVNCNAVQDSVLLSFTPSPTANAGSDITVCSNNPEVSLNGQVTVAGGGVWSGGAGTFVPNAQTLNAVYEPTGAELSSGSLILTLTTTNNTNCNAVSDNVLITFTPGPQVFAGFDNSYCANNAEINLAGTVINAGGGQWTGGLGSYSPNSQTLNATYTPSQEEINNGFVTLTLTSTNNATCLAEEDQVTFTFTPAPTVDAGLNQSLCSNNAMASLSGTVTVATGAQWSGGDNPFTPNANSLNVTYQPSAAEIASGSVRLYLTSTGNVNCNAVQDSVLLSFTASPTANAGSDITVCANNAEVSLNGQVTVAGGGVWSGGAGTFIPNAQTLNATYQPTAAEIAFGSLTLTLTTTDNTNCIAVSDDVQITITPGPQVFAGFDNSFCANNAEINLAGTILNAGGGQWSGGLGSYSPNSQTLNATYTPSQEEINNGFVTLTLTSTNNATCLAEEDQVTFTFTPAPTVDAGLNQSLCSNNAEASLTGTVAVATGAQWSGGDNPFTPNANSLNVTYQPSAAEIASGSVRLYLTSTGNVNCNAVQDSVLLSFTASPTANAGSDITVCANNAEVSLNGQVTVAAGGVWSGGAGLFSPNPQTLNATYQPTPAEINSGGITLTLTTTNPGTCLNVSDQVDITFSPAPQVDAGMDDSYCANNAEVGLNGSVLGAGGGQWTGGLGSYSPNSQTLNATYTPSQEEINNGFVTLTLTSTNNATCLAEEDQVTFTFTPAPTVDAGLNQSLCSNNAEASLTGTVTVATGAQWSGGDNPFTPNANSLNVTYQPSAAEIASGSVRLYLTSTGNVNCNAVQDSVLLSFTASPTANAGSDITVCANNTEVSLNGQVTVAGGGVWSGGAGLFSPNPQTLNATYQPTPAEINSGGITLTLTTTNPGTCLNVSDQVDITFSPAPQVDAGMDDSYCANNAEVGLNGSVLGAGGGQWTGGLGSYSPNSQTLNATYTPSQEEINNGFVTLTLTSTNNATCLAEEDQVTFTFTPAPTVDAGLNQSLCSNNAEASLTGTVTVATGAQWSGGDNPFTPNANSLNVTYQPSAAEIASGSVRLYLTSTGNVNCNAVQDSVLLSFTASPTANAGSDITVCANNAEVSLNGQVTVAAGGVWSGGAGTFIPNAQTLNATYQPTPAEINGGSMMLTLTTINNANCLPASDNVSITFGSAPLVAAGPDEAYCSNNPEIQLNGSVQNVSGGIWTGGTGTFLPNNQALDAVYTPSPPEIGIGSVTLVLYSLDNGNCLQVSDSVVYTFTTAPTANAGSDIQACVAEGSANLSGSITVAGGAQWSGGDGSFVPNNFALNANYQFGPSDISNGIAKLYLTTISNGNCLPVTDSLILTLDPIPIVDAGDNFSICENNPIILLNGSVLGASGGVWTGGAGVFNPSNTALTTTYLPTPIELQGESLTLYLTTTGNGLCAPDVDSIEVAINPSPSVSAGADQFACANNPTVQLSGAVQFASGVEWSGGAGSFSPSNTVLNPVYNPTADELSAGSVILTITSTGNGTCNPEFDQVQILYAPAPVVNAGSDQSVCGNNPSVNLSGSVVNAAGGIWEGGNGTFIPSNTSLNAIYVPSEGEIINGSVTLLLRSTGNGNCFEESDEMVIEISDPPEVDAGPDVVNCVDDLNVSLSGTVSGPTNTGIWSTSGTGFFIPNNTDLNATYVISSQDSINGGVTLVLTSTNNLNCLPVSDSLRVSVFPVGIANAGPNQSVCKNNAIVQLNGSISGAASSGVWSTSGTGEFVPNAQTLNAQYIPSEQDLTGNSITLQLTADACNLAVDQLFIELTPSPSVLAGENQTICFTETEIQLDGAITGGSSTGIWSTTGNGNFSPSNETLDAVYTITSEDSLNQVVSFVLASTNNGTCLAEFDTLDVFIFPPGTASAGEDQLICSTDDGAVVQGILGGLASEGLWTSSGSGVFVPFDTSQVATYIPSEQDVINGSVTLTFTATNSCNLASDDLNLTIQPGPQVLTYIDTIICGTNPSLFLSGVVSNATGGIWSTSGSGSFGNENEINTTYTASNQDVIDGNVILTLTSTGNGICSPGSDSFNLSFSDGIQVNAGLDQEVCISATEIQLAGFVGNGTSTGVWSTTGNGSFQDSSMLNTIYFIDPSDVTAGSITFTLESTNNGNCAAETDQMFVDFGNTVFVFAGEDAEFCSTLDALPLNGLVSGGSSTGSWSTSGSGIFIPDANTLNATYIPSIGDSLIGGFNLTLVSTNNGGCLPGSDTRSIGLLPLPQIDLGPNQTACWNIDTLEFSPTIENSSSIEWSTTGAGIFFPSVNDPNAVYIADPSDKIAPFQIKLQSRNNEPCESAEDAITITFTEPIEISAGNDLQTCASDLILNLSAQATGAASFQWSTSGSGLFVPNNSVLNPQYYASTADSLLGGVKLYFTAEDQLGCDIKTDSVQVTISYLPVVNAGNNIISCHESDTISLNGVVNHTQGVNWTTNGLGFFSPGPGSAQTNYLINPLDKEMGEITFVLTAIPLNPCPSRSDTLTLNILQPISASAGDDAVICSSTSEIPLLGETSGVSQSVWTTSGTGNFLPGPQALDAIYQLSNSDKLQERIVLYLTTINENGCTEAMDSLQILINPFVAVDAGNDINVCNNETEVNLSGEVSVNLPVQWTTSGTGVFIPDPDSLAPTYIISSTDRLYDAIYLVLSAQQTGACPAASDTVVLTFANPLEADFGWEGNCANNLIFFADSTIINSGTIESFLWNFGDGGQSQVQNPSHTFIAEGAYEVQLIAYSNQTCHDTIVQQVIIDPQPFAGFDAEETETEFKVQFTNEADGASIFFWDFGDGVGTSEVENPSYTYPEENVYNVTQFVTNAYGCQDSLSKSVTVFESESIPPITPDGFSPNEDGINDVFYVRGGPFSSMNLKIYNGWGELIYETNDIEKGWDGTYNGQVVQVGVYIYVVDAIGVSGKPYKIQGNVTVIK
jgi:gliding motility-associated-like protein